jgi:predicted DNA binding CopG/RHH family protein
LFVVCQSLHIRQNVATFKKSIVIMWQHLRNRGKTMKRTRRTLKKIKDSSIRIRISSDKKEEIKKYCENKGFTITSFMDLAIDELLKK